MSARRITPDPLDEARAFGDEAERARGDWRRVLVATARMKLDEATAGLNDSEAALKGHAEPVVQQMRKTVEKRRSAIEKLSDRLDVIDDGEHGWGT